MLKPLNELLVAAPQHRYFASTSGGQITFAEHYDDVAKLPLNPTVPADIVTSFDLARHAFIYAWFSYDLLMVSAPQALATMEMGFRMRLAGSTAAKKTLEKMIDEARLAGLLPLLAPGQSDPLHLLRKIRNDLMHGSTNQYDPNITLMVLGLVTDTLNHLFPAP